MKSAPIKILQIGAGSMGTRRLRDLTARPGTEVRLLDARPDRRERAQSRFGVKTYEALPAALEWEPEALVISTPPGTKGPFVQLALDRNIHHFVEADIWSYGAAERVAQAKGVVCAPSLTFSFLPVVKAMIEKIPAVVGPLLGYQFFLAGDMTAWHPTEGNEYYGRHRDTAPAREMVAFELAWLARIFGQPKQVAGQFGCHSRRAGAMEDTWSLLMQLERGGTGQLTVTMASPHDYRCGSAFGTRGAATWDIMRGELKLLTPSQPPEILQFGEAGKVIEATYAAEINAYVDAIQGGAPWLHAYADYQLALATLAAAEVSAGTDTWTRIVPRREPERILPIPRA